MRQKASLVADVFSDTAPGVTIFTIKEARL